MPRVVSSNVARITESWKAPAALDTYLRRIGAEVRNFRCYVIKREGRDHYHYDATIIRVVDGKIYCPDTAYAPTPEEAAAIEKEIAYEMELQRWPRHIAARNTDNLKAILGNDATLYEFQNPEGEVIFVQQRVRNDDGTKNDFPWSFWSDGRWRSMEPEGQLPLFGLEKLKDAATVFIHEGAKCAHAMTPEFLKGHPWRDELEGPGIVHVGWPAGAPNPHRVDWEPIRALSRHKRVIIVGDNDISGNNAVPKISRTLQRRCEALSFGTSFPAHFDLAEPWPENLEAKFEECVIGATWATRAYKIEGKTHYELREEFEAECNYTVRPALYIHRLAPHITYDEKEFNNKFRNFSDVTNVAALLLKSFHAQAECLAYEPTMPTGRCVIPNIGMAWNGYTPGKVKPHKGDIKPFMEFMEHLFPVEEDRHNAKRWIATLIARPGIKMRYGMLLVSEAQGVGKDTLGSAILTPLMGHHNVSHPSEEMVNDRFNGWIMNKRLAIVSEIYQGHSSACYNRLKNIITDQFLSIRMMHTNPFDINNHCHLLAFSNSMRALKLDSNDRRWFIPTVSENKRDKAYWQKLYAWIAAHLSSICWWANDFCKDPDNVIEAGEYPPMTTRKMDVIRDAMSPGEVLVDELAAAFMSRGEPVAMRLDRVRIWVSDRKQAIDPVKYRDDHLLENGARIAAIFRSRGGKIGKQMRSEAGGPRFKCVTNFDTENNEVWSYIKTIEKTPQEVFSWTDEGQIFG